MFHVLHSSPFSGKLSCEISPTYILQGPHLHGCKSHGIRTDLGRKIGINPSQTARVRRVILVLASGWYLALSRRGCPCTSLCVQRRCGDTPDYAKLGRGGGTARCNAITWGTHRKRAFQPVGPRSIVLRIRSLLRLYLLRYRAAPRGCLFFHPAAVANLQLVRV